MRRYFLSLIAAVAFALVANPVFAADTMKATTMTKTCPTGQTLVKAYTKKDGTKVAAYCRKATKPAAMGTTAPKK
jgi:hypothetical protein